MGQHPSCPYDEVYYVLRGHAKLTLGDEKGERFDLGPDMVAYIPCEVDHELENVGAGDLELIMIMFLGLNKRERPFCTTSASPVGNAVQRPGTFLQ